MPHLPETFRDDLGILRDAQTGDRIPLEYDDLIAKGRAAARSEDFPPEFRTVMLSVADELEEMQFQRELGRWGQHLDETVRPNLVRRTEQLRKRAREMTIRSERQHREAAAIARRQDEIEARIAAAERKCLPDNQTSTCQVCGGPMAWQDAPTGGWWVHESHPKVNPHDASVPWNPSEEQDFNGNYTTLAEGREEN